MTDQPIARSDGGVRRGTSGGSEREHRRQALDVTLPEDSLFTLEEYLELYDVASSEPAFSILCALSDAERLSTGELSEILDRDGNDLHYYLRKLKRCALVQNRRDPNTGTDEPYSYYLLTDLGHTVLTHGLKAGLEKLAAEEATISEKYDA